MLNTITTTVPNQSRPPLALLNFVDTYSLSSTIDNALQTNANTNATSNPCSTLYQPHTAPYISPSATLPSSSSTVNPKTLLR